MADYDQGNLPLIDEWEDLLENSETRQWKVGATYETYDEAMDAAGDDMIEGGYVVCMVNPGGTFTLAWLR